MVDVILIVLLVCAAGAVAAWWLPRVLASFHAQTRGELAERNADVDRRLEAVVETMDRRLGELDTKVDRRLESAQRTTSDIHERLGKQGAAAAQKLQPAKGPSPAAHAPPPPKGPGGVRGAPPGEPPPPP